MRCTVFSQQPLWAFLAEGCVAVGTFRFIGTSIATVAKFTAPGTDNPSSKTVLAVSKLLTIETAKGIRIDPDSNETNLYVFRNSW